MDPDKITIQEIFNDRLRSVQKAWDNYLRDITDDGILNFDCLPMKDAREKLELAIFDLFEVKELRAKVRNDFGKGK